MEARAVKVFKSRIFGRFSRRAGLADAALIQAALEVRAGQHDGDLGGGVFKKRVAREGGGKSGGYRTVLVCSNAAFTVFVHGYAKKDRANMDAIQLVAFRKLSADFRDITLAQAQKIFLDMEISHDN